VVSTGVDSPHSPQVSQVRHGGLSSSDRVPHVRDGGLSSSVPQGPHVRQGLSSSASYMLAQDSKDAPPKPEDQERERVRAREREDGYRQTSASAPTTPRAGISSLSLFFF